MTKPSRIASLVALLVLPVLIQCQSRDALYGFSRDGEPTVHLSGRFSDLAAKVLANALHVVGEKKFPSGWRSITVSYKGLEITYFAESDGIYSLRSSVPEWYLSAALRVGAVLDVGDLPRTPVRVLGVKETYVEPYVETEGGYLLPFYYRLGVENVAAYCSVELGPNMVITGLGLMIAVD